MTSIEAMTPTRRDVLKTSLSAVLAAGIAGCTDGGGEDGDAGTEEESTGEGGGTGNYAVEMAPVGELEFEAPPERVTTYFPGYADMCAALDVGDSLIAMGEVLRYHAHHYDELEDVGIDPDELEDVVGDEGIDKEVFYELGSDLHLIDPEWLINNEFFGLDESDVEEIRENVAPFLGNTIFRRSDEWHDYEYYTLYEAFEKVAQVYQREERFEALASFHDEYVADVQSRLPPEEERPAGLLTFAESEEPEEFYPYQLSDEGTNNEQWHDLGVEDALEGTGIEGLSTSDRGTIDYETMLEVDPDVVLIRSEEVRSAEEFEDTYLAYMREHPIASELTAVREGRVIRGGPIYQGPLIHLFTLEQGARDLFPEEFGDEELFDRDEVAAIVNGER
jgi:iron complex transport system substrate-binding protein